MSQRLSSGGGAAKERGPPTVNVKLALLGDCGVGKTCMMLRYMKNTFSTKVPNTTGVDFQSQLLKQGDNLVKVHIYDTAGQEAYRALLASYFRSSHGFIVVYDVTEQRTFDSIRRWVDDVHQQSRRPSVSMILVGNKADSPARVVPPEAGEALAQELGMQFFETSAKTNLNLKEVFMGLTKMVLKTFTEDEGDQPGIDLVPVKNTKARSSGFGCC